MPLFLLPFPTIDPVLVEFGPFIVRWYALAYIAGLILGWRLALTLVQSPSLWGERTRPETAAIDDLLVYIAFGIVLGGRLGHVVFYEFSFYAAHPAEILAVWHGGMAFHGGLIGAAVAMILLARLRHLPILALTDVASAVVPIGLFFGRIANFINGELWGRPTDVAWAMIFPRADDQPRHPSQLYEAGLEGAAIFLALMLAVRFGGLKRPGLISGLFGILYAIARTVSEFFRDPDPLTEQLPGGFTMGMALSVPMVVIGLWLVGRSLRAETRPA
jgi:phosphatidylglycerol:prolipoprotein diacylglycerol transferase